jgi:omega-6 fatty acid desaturase (delta-12 desaturase)
LQERLNAAGDSAGIDMRALTQDLAGYREPHHGRSVVEILITIVPLVLLWLSMWFALKLGYGIYLLLAVPAAGFMVRLFMIQYDTAGNFHRRGGVALRVGISLALTRRGVGLCRK